MDRVYDKQAAVAEQASEFNFEDQHELDATNAAMHVTCTEYVRQSELHEVNPNPILHPHTPHEEKAEFCKRASWFFTVIGVVVTILLTAGAVDWPLPGAIAATAVFLMLEFGVNLGIAAAIPEKIFARRFHALYWPWFCVLLGSVALLWLGRNAGPELAAILVKYNTVGWCGAEVSLLFLGAYAFVGRRRFGWSGDAVRQVAALEARAAELSMRIDRRNGKLLSAFFILFFAGAAAHAGCPLIMVDRSGSLDEQDRAENHLISAIAGYAYLMNCARVAVFSGRALSAEAVPIEFTNNAAASHDIFRSVIEARRNLVRDEAKTKMLGVLNSADRKAAACTSMVDVSARALLDTAPVLVLTDGVHDCPSSSVPMPAQTSDRIFVVLAASKGDHGNEFELYAKRAAGLRRLMPKVQIFTQAQMADAVAGWAAALQTAGLIKASL